jgi:glycosyltransferase involved in cell wall biosynthesis
VVYIVGSKLLNFLRAKRLKERLVLPLKFVEEVILLNIRRLFFYYGIRRELKNADIIVDYGMCLMNHPKLIKNKKTVIYNHFSLNHINKRSVEKNLQKVRCLANYTKVIAICDEMIEQFLKYLPNESDKITRIYNFINPSELQAKAKIGVISCNHPYILAIGRLDESQKDYTTLLKGYALARNEYTFEHDLVILGQGRDKEKLVRLCIDLEIMPFVHFIGFDDNPYKWLQNCSFFVHSSKFEGLPTVIIEAMMLGKCVVASNCPTGVRELLLRGKAGLLFEVGNITELASKLNILANDIALQESVLKETEFILEQFSKQNTIGKVEQLLMELAD